MRNPVGRPSIAPELRRKNKMFHLDQQVVRDFVAACEGKSASRQVEALMHAFISSKSPQS